MENKVGYLRRNELVPIPRFISELFEEDKARLLPLPSVPFDTALYTTAQQINMANLPLMWESTATLLHRLFVIQSSILRLHHLL